MHRAKSTKLISLGETEPDCRESNETDRESLWSSFISPLKHSCAGQSRTPKPEWKIDVSLWITPRCADYTADGTKLSVSPRGFPDFCRPRLRNFKLRVADRELPWRGPSLPPLLRRDPKSLRRDSVGEYVSATFREGGKKVCAASRAAGGT